MFVIRPADDGWHTAPAPRRPLHPMSFSLRSKLFAGFGAVLVLMTLLGLFSVTRLGAMHSAAHELGHDTVPSLELIGSANGLVSTYRKDQLRYAVATDAATRKDAGADIA